MNAPAAHEAVKLPLSEARIPDDLFAQMRKQNLARWPTGAVPASTSQPCTTLG